MKEYDSEPWAGLEKAGEVNLLKRPLQPEITEKI